MSAAGGAQPWLLAAPSSPARLVSTSSATARRIVFYERSIGSRGRNCESRERRKGGSWRWCSTNVTHKCCKSTVVGECWLAYYRSACLSPSAVQFGNRRAGDVAEKSFILQDGWAWRRRGIMKEGLEETRHCVSRREWKRSKCVSEPSEKGECCSEGDVAAGGSPSWGELSSSDSHSHPMERRRLLITSIAIMAGVMSDSRNAFAENTAAIDDLPLVIPEETFPEETFPEETFPEETFPEIDSMPSNDVFAIEEIGEEDEVFGFDGLGHHGEDYAASRVVALAQSGEGAVLFLGVDGYELPMRMVVGAAEAMAVLTAAQERKSRRPVTHEAWGLTLEAVGWQVARVAITSIDNDVYYCRVILGDANSSLQKPRPVLRSVDVRPSDGIALALRCKAPLFVSRQVAESVLLKGQGKKPKGDLKVDPLDRPGLQARQPHDLSNYI